MEIIEPFSKGKINDWDAYEKILSNTYDNPILAKARDYCLLLSETNIHN